MIGNTQPCSALYLLLLLLLPYFFVSLPTRFFLLLLLPLPPRYIGPGDSFDFGSVSLLFLLIQIPLEAKRTRTREASIPTLSLSLFLSVVLSPLLRDLLLLPSCLLLARSPCICCISIYLSVYTVSITDRLLQAVVRSTVEEGREGKGREEKWMEDDWMFDSLH